MVSDSFFHAGTYVLSESGPAGYSTSGYSWDDGSLDGQTLTLALGDVVTCEIHNDDIPPRLTLNKILVKDNGGGASESDWNLTASGPTGFSGDGPSVSSDAEFDAGTYNLSESVGPDGYTAGSWVCIGTYTQDDADTITLALGDDATCTITNDDIAPSLTLNKILVKDNGGGASEDDWTLTATGPTGFSGAGPSVSNGVSFDAGTYDLSEDGPDGYTASDWVCIGNDTQVDADTITLALGDNVTCTITNDDDAPSLTLVKDVKNDNGGTAGPGVWTLTATGTLVDATNLSGNTPVASGTDFMADTYTLDESGGPDGYSTTGYRCDGGTQIDAYTITLGLGESATCTITNDDIQPQLTVIKDVVNDDDGTASADAFNIAVTGDNATPSEFAGDEDGVIVDLDAGPYSVSESGPGGYTPNFSADCFGEIAVGQALTCTITNDDIGSDDATLTVIKTMVNNNGGTDVAGGFMMTVNLPGGGTVSFPGAGDPGTTIGLALGDYTVTEVEHAGYTASYSTDCTGEVIATTDQFTCTITNDDIGPRLTVTKTVTNDNGGTMQIDDFPLFVDGNAVTSGVEYTYSAGHLYTVSDPGDPGYAASVWGGACAADGTITMELDTDYSCTITNDDIAPSLTLVKEMKNDNGGTAGPGDWILTATGTLAIPTNLNGTTGVASGADFNADIYTKVVPLVKTISELN